MKFARIVFLIAAVWGVLTLTPLYFIFNTISLNDPPAITHPGFYYGFVGTALAWQFVFFLIARDPVRLRLMMLPSAVEKFAYGIAVTVLCLQGRMHTSDLTFGGVDLILGLLFVVAYFKTPARAQ